eukprot:7117797-Prymnesium_polylepis.1
MLPIDTAVAALVLAGQEPITVAILKAIGKLPADWVSATSSPEQEGGDEGSTSGTSGGGGASGGGEEEEGEEDGEEEEEEGGEEDGEEEDDGDGDDGDEECDASSAKKAKLDSYTLTLIPDSLERDLAAYARFRAQPLNVLREGRACGETTLAENRNCCFAQRSGSYLHFAQLARTPQLHFAQLAPRKWHSGSWGG